MTNEMKDLMRSLAEKAYEFTYNTEYDPEPGTKVQSAVRLPDGCLAKIEFEVCEPCGKCGGGQ